MEDRIDLGDEEAPEPRLWSRRIRGVTPCAIKTPSGMIFSPWA